MCDKISGHGGPAKLMHKINHQKDIFREKRTAFVWMSSMTETGLLDNQGTSAYCTT